MDQQSNPTYVQCTRYLYLFRPDRQGGSLAVMEQLVEANYNMENIYMI